MTTTMTMTITKDRYSVFVWISLPPSLPLSLSSSPSSWRCRAVHAGDRHGWGPSCQGSACRCRFVEKPTTVSTILSSIWDPLTCAFHNCGRDVQWIFRWAGAYFQFFWNSIVGMSEIFEFPSFFFLPFPLVPNIRRHGGFIFLAFYWQGSISTSCFELVFPTGFSRLLFSNFP